MTTRVRRTAAAAVVATLALTVAGCSTGVNADRVQTAVTAQFSRLYAAQQGYRGRTVSIADLRTHSRCGRGNLPTGTNNQGGGNSDAGDPTLVGTTGGGDDWQCLITFDVQAGNPIQAKYSLQVRTNGCYSADGDGPTELNGDATLLTDDGRTVPNPLWRFDGCFDTLG